jgi:Fic family protein
MKIQKKKRNNKEYYYLVSSTRINGKVKKIERYLGLNYPTKEEIKKFKKDFNNTKLFLEQNKEKLEKIKNNNLKEIKNSSKDKLYREENEKIISYTYESSRIEGSSLTKTDTKLLLNNEISPKNKSIRDIKETQNHRDAYFFIKDNLKKEISKELILKLHAILKKDVTEDAGKFRDRQVFVSDLIPIKADLINNEIDNIIRWYKNNIEMHIFEKIVIFHCKFEKIHPFFDGNGRVGRLILNYMLMKENYPIVILKNKNKRRYYNALKKADDENYLYMLKYVFSEFS